MLQALALGGGHLRPLVHEACPRAAGILREIGSREGRLLNLYHQQRPHEAPDFKLLDRPQVHDEAHPGIHHPAHVKDVLRLGEAAADDGGEAEEEGAAQGGAGLARRTLLEELRDLAHEGVAHAGEALLAEVVIQEEAVDVREREAICDEDHRRGEEEGTEMGGGLDLWPGAGEGLQGIQGPGMGPEAGGKHVEGGVSVLAEVDVDEALEGIRPIEEAASRQVAQAVQ